MDFAGMKRRELQALCKRHGLPAGGTNADLVSRLDAALSDAAGVEEEVDVVGVEARKGCLKRSVGDAGEAKKVTFAVEESRGRRLRSRVVWSPVVAKTRGKRAEAATDSAADGGISAEAGANVPVRRSRRNSLTAAEAEEVGEAVTVDRKRKRKSNEIAEEVAVSPQAVVSCRVTRRSSLSGTTILLPPAVEKKRGKGKAADGKNKLVAEEQVAEAQGLPAAGAPTVVESKRSRRKGENCEPDMQKYAKVEVSARTTRSCSVEAAVMSPTMVENKRRKTGPDVQLPTVSEVPRNDAPATRSLRNRVAQVSNSVVEETHIGNRLENKMQPSRPATRRHQQAASCAEEEDQEQVAVPSKFPPLRRSGRNNSEVSNANAETDKLSSIPVEAKDSNVARPLTHHNAQAEDVEKQPAVKEPVRRSTRKSVASVMLEKEKDLTEEKNIEAPVRRSTRNSVASVMLEKEEKDLTEEKNTEAPVRRSTRKSIVPVKDIKGVGKELQNAKGEAVVEQQTIKEPVRRSTRKSVASNMLEKEKDLIAEKNPETHVRRSFRKSIVPVKDTKGVGAKGEDIAKQPALKEPVRRSRRSVATVVLEEQNKDVHQEKKSEIPMGRSTRRSIALNVVGKGNTDHTETTGSDRLGVGTRKQKARVQLTDGAVAAITSENKLQVEVTEQSNQGVQRSTHNSSNHNLSDDNKAHHDPNKCLSHGTVGEEGSKLRKRRRSSIEISSPANHSWNMEDFGGQKFRNQQDAQTPNEKDNIGVNCEKPVRTQHISSSTTLKGLPVKRRGTTAPEEVMSVEEAKSDDMVIGEATEGRYKVAHEYSKESSSQIQEIGHVNATGEEFSSGPLPATVADEICTVQSVHKVLPGSESGDVDKWCQNPEIYHSCTMENLDKSKQSQEHSDIQTDDSNISETGNGKLDQSSSVPELIPNTGIISENKTLMDEGEVNMGANDMQILNVGSYEVGLEDLNKSVDLAQEIRTTTAVPCSEAEAHIVEGYTVNAEIIKQLDEEVASPILSCSDDTNVTVTESQFARQKDSQDVGTDDVLPIDFNVRFCEEPSPVARQGRVSGEGNTSESRHKNLADVISSGLHTKGLQHDCDVLTKETGEASEPALPISDSKPEFLCDAIAEESTQVADLGKCLSKGGQEDPLLTDLHSEGAADDIIVPVQNAAEGCSSDGRHSPFGLKFLFAEEEECKESYSSNGENAAEEVDFGNKPSTCVTPTFSVGSGCGLEDEDEQPVGYDAHEKLDADQCIGQEEVIAEEKSNDEHVATKIDLNTKLNDKLISPYMESDCSIAEKNMGLVALNPDDGQAMVQVQQGDVQEGNLEKASLCATTPECKHECGFPEETLLHSMKNKGYLSSAEQSPFGLQFLFSQESIGKSVEYSGLASATVHAANGVDELEDCHAKCALGKIPQSGLVSLHTHDGSSLVSENDDCMFTFKQDNGLEGLPQISHDEERVSSRLSGFTVNANDIKEVINSEEVACMGEGSRKHVHSEDINEKSDVNGPADNTYGISGAVLSHSLHGAANDNDDVYLSSTLVQLESTGVLDETTGCSNTEMQHQGHKDRSDEDREERVAFIPCTNNIIEATTVKYIESGMVLIPAEERSNLQDGQLNSKFEGAKVVESDLDFNKDGSNILDNGYVVGIVGKRTSSDSGLPKDSSTEPYPDLRHELLDGLSVETSLEGSATLGQTNASRVGTVGNPSFSLATPDYKHEGALSEEATIKNYAGTCSPNPRDLLMELQSLFSKENIEESDPHDGLASPSAESGGDESTDIEQQVKVQFGSNRSQLEPTDLLDELIGCPNTEVQHQGYKDQCSEDRDDQVASRPCSNNIMEAANARYIDSGVVIQSSEERSNLKDGQLNPKLEGPKVMESGLNCNKEVCTTAYNGSVAGIVGKETPSGSGLPKDYPQQKLLDGFSMETSFEVSTLFGEKIVSDVAGTVGNPSVNLATPDYKHEGALSEEAMRRMKNYAGTRSSDPKQLIMELQSLFSKGSIEKSDTHDGLAFQCAESGRGESTTCHVKELVDTPVSSEPGTNQDNEHEGFLKSSRIRDCVMLAQFDLSDAAHRIERDSIVDELLCAEKEKRKSTPTSDSDILHEKLHSDKQGIKILESGVALAQASKTSTSTDEQLTPELEGRKAERHSFSCEKGTSNIPGTRSVMNKMSLFPKDSHTVYYQEQELPNDLSGKSAEESAICEDGSVFESGNFQPCAQKHIDEINSKLSSCDTEVLHQDHKEECNGPNEDEVTPEVLENDMSEGAPVEGTERARVLLSGSGTSEMPDEQLNTKLESHEGEEHSFSCDKDTIQNFYTRSVKNDLPSFPKERHIDSWPKTPEESANYQDESASGSGPCQTSGQQCTDESSGMQLTCNVEAISQDNEERNENNEDRITPGIPASSMSEAAQIERLEREIGLTPVAGTSALPDEELHTKLEGNRVDEHSCCYDKDMSSLFDTELLNSIASSLHKDTLTDPSSEDNPPNDLSAPRSPEESTVFQNDSVPGSVGICQSSRRRGIDELRAKLQSFKVSSTVKGSYIAMSAPRPKQGDNLSQSAITLLRNRENAPAVKADHPAKPNPDRSVAKDSSRRALQPISGRPRDH